LLTFLLEEFKVSIKEEKPSIKKKKKGKMLKKKKKKKKKIRDKIAFRTKLEFPMEFLMK
jgi:hypothetical protein